MKLKLLKLMLAGMLVAASSAQAAPQLLWPILSGAFWGGAEWIKGMAPKKTMTTAPRPPSESPESASSSGSIASTTPSSISSPTTVTITSSSASYTGSASSSSSAPSSSSSSSSSSSESTDVTSDKKKAAADEKAAKNISFGNLAGISAFGIYALHCALNGMKNTEAGSLYVGAGLGAYHAVDWALKTDSAKWLGRTIAKNAPSVLTNVGNFLLAAVVAPIWALNEGCKQAKNNPSYLAIVALAAWDIYAYRNS